MKYYIYIVVTDEYGLSIGMHKEIKKLGPFSSQKEAEEYTKELYHVSEADFDEIGGHLEELK